MHRQIHGGPIMIEEHLDIVGAHRGIKVLLGERYNPPLTSGHSLPKSRLLKRIFIEIDH